MAVQIIDDRSVSLRRPAAPSPVGMSAAPAVPDIQPRLIAPAIAAPGEWIVVLAFKNAGLCGQAELRFDGSPLHHRLTGNAGSRLPNWVEMFLAVQVPRSATTGMHTVDLYGSAANLCNEVGKHQAKLATTTIIVGPRRA
jgi:hypothetical protein